MIDIDLCIAELHDRLYSQQVLGRACSDRVEILYHFLRYHNQKPSVARYKRRDGHNMVLISGETVHQSHVVVVLDNWVLDSNLKVKLDKKAYIQELYELNENRVIEMDNYTIRHPSYFIKIVRDNLSQKFQEAFNDILKSVNEVIENPDKGKKNDN